MYIADLLLIYPSLLIKLNKTLNKKDINLPCQHLLTYKNLIMVFYLKKKTCLKLLFLKNCDQFELILTKKK